MTIRGKMIGKLKICSHCRRKMFRSLKNHVRYKNYTDHTGTRSWYGSYCYECAEVIRKINWEAKILEEKMAKFEGRPPRKNKLKNGIFVGWVEFSDVEDTAKAILDNIDSTEIDDSLDC